MYSIVFLALTLKLPIQTSLTVAPKLQVCVHSGGTYEHFSKTSIPLGPILNHDEVFFIFFAEDG